MTTVDGARLDLEIAATAKRLAELLEQRAAIAADAEPAVQAGNPADELRQIARDLGIPVCSQGTVSERDAARLLGRSALTLRNRRLTDQPIPFERVGRTVRYRIDVLAKHLRNGT
ncbi:MAG: hypothetical protein KK478_00135 [Ensifer alkalisoli]|nr:hypothetical protein [Sinorhizobium alkalisoli]